MRNRKNLRVPIGTRFSDIVEYCGGLSEKGMNLLISGGPMMGKSQYTFDVPVTKTTSGILFMKDVKLAEIKERPCIRCGRCETVCPAALKPWLLANLSRKKEIKVAEEYRLFQCMECGSCSYICPSKRNLVQWIKYCKVRNMNLKDR